jgi:ABC-type sugar transport system ATPase subunit
MVGETHISLGLTTQGDPSSELDGLVNRPVVLEVDSVSVEGVVDRVSIAVRERERVGLAGLAGSGKTELAEVIVGQRKPTEGRIVVRGKPLLAARVDFAREIGIAFVPQERHANGFCSNLSVEENIALPILRGLSRWGFIMWRRRRELVSSMIERLQIKVSDPAQNASELSGGNQQKIVVAKVLATEPRLLLLDEPTYGVDVGAAADLATYIRRQAEAGMAVLWASSDLREVTEITDRALILADGVIRTSIDHTSPDFTESALIEAMQRSADHSLASDEDRQGTSTR